MVATVYFDHNATTPLDSRVMDAMLPFLTGQFGNPSSRHGLGRAARDAVDRARRQVARAVGADQTEVVFTSGGTEANNLFLKGAAARLAPGAVVVSAVEHPSVLKPAVGLAKQGWTSYLAAVDGAGRVDQGAWSSALAKHPKLVSLMMANNETGVVQDVAEHASEARSAGAICHTDAVQAFGRHTLDFRALRVHALTVSSHKIGGPKGAGALVLDKRVDLCAALDGGGQERGLRSGTENVAAIVGFGKACELIAERLTKHHDLEHLRNILERGVLAMGAVVFGSEAKRLGNTTCFAFPGIDGETLVDRLDRAGYAVASGAACSSANPDPSHVLLAMGVTPETARGAVRVSLGPESSEAEVRGFLAALPTTLNDLRQIASVAV